jgi:hypothetical protein
MVSAAKTSSAAAIQALRRKRTGKVGAGADTSAGEGARGSAIACGCVPTHDYCFAACAKRLAAGEPLGS